VSLAIVRIYAALGPGATVLGHRSPMVSESFTETSRTVANRVAERRFGAHWLRLATRSQDLGSGAARRGGFKSLPVHKKTDVLPGARAFEQIANVQSCRPCVEVSLVHLIVADAETLPRDARGAPRCSGAARPASPNRQRGRLAACLAASLGVETDAQVTAHAPKRRKEDIRTACAALNATQKRISFWRRANGVALIGEAT
jgi:hypothetical protein